MGRRKIEDARHLPYGVFVVNLAAMESIWGFYQRYGQDGAFLSARRELSFAKTACRASQNTPAWSVNPMGLVETMINAITNRGG
jgi:hypothetical protein